MKKGLLNKKTIFEFVQMVLGNAICAFSVVCFVLPYDMVASGVSGIGRMLDHYTGLGVTLIVAVINIALFIIGAAVLGRRFASTIALGTFAYPLFMSLFDKMTSLQHMVGDPMLAAVCAGVLDGIGLGLVLRIGGSTGGIDVPAMIMNRKLGWKLSTVMLATDIIIFLIQIPVTAPEGIILGILYTLVYSLVMDRMIVMSQGGYQMIIWTDKVSEVNECLLRLGFGTTLLKARGGYLHDDKDVIMCATSTRSLARAKRAVLGIDEKAFITVGSINEVNGNGFTYLTEENYEPELEDRRNGR